MMSREKTWLCEWKIEEVRTSDMSVEYKVLAIRDKVHDMPCVEIAKVLGISREWVRKLLERNGKPTNLLRLGKFCNECGKKLERLPKRGMCRSCWSVKSKVDVDCAGCGISMKVTKPLYDRAIKSDRYKGNHYCSRPCFDANKGPYDKRNEETSYTHICQVCNKEKEVFGPYEIRKALSRKYCVACRLALYHQPAKIGA